METIEKLKKELVSKQNYTFDNLKLLVEILRGPEGCVWDREQTAKSVRNCFIDETYEFIEGLDNDDDKLMCEELGDVLFQIMFHADIKRDEKAFDINDVIDGICRKMILRHPHVFGDVSVSDSGEVLVNWENIKNDEKSRRTPYEQLDSVAKSLPSLMRSQKLQKKADKTGLRKFDGIEKGIDDIQNALDSFRKSKNKEDLGRILFAVCGVSQMLDAESEEILYIENEKFLKSFE